MSIVEKYKYKKITMILLIPLLIVGQYYLFKFGILKPMIKGAEIKIVNGDYIQDIDKYVIRLGESVTLSSGEYIKLPKYAKDPDIKFRLLDDSKVLKIIDNDENEKNTATLIGLKKGYSSIAIVKGSRVLKKATILVVDPKVESLDLNVDKNLVFVGDSANINSSIEVDYKRFKDKYEVSYESSNEKVLKIENNIVKAVGVGRATIYAKSGDKVDSIRYNINAKISKMEIENTIELKVGESQKITPKVTTSPRGLKHPTINYQLVQSKLPIERAIRLDSNGTIVGLREGEEKVLVSCGVGSNKKSKIVTIKVVKDSIKDKLITDLSSSFEIVDGKMLVTLIWSSLPDIYNYDIYLRNNSEGETEYSVVQSIIMDKIDLDNDNKIKAVLEIDIEDITNIDLDIYVVGINDSYITENSNIVNIKHDLYDSEDEKIDLEATFDENNKKIDLSWNSINDCTYNVYVKDMSKGDDEFTLYYSNINDTNIILYVESTELNLEVYVSALKDGKEEVKSDIKVFK